MAPAVQEGGSLRAVFWLFVVLIVFWIFAVYISRDEYIVKYLNLTPKTKLELQKNNITKYVLQTLREIKNSTIRKQELGYHRQLISDRRKIIKMLPRVTKIPFHTTFHVLLDTTRKVLGHSYDMVILVSSYSLHFKRRRDLRNSWGNVNTSLNKNWTLVFLTGGVNDDRGMKMLYKEAVEYRDVIIEDFMESYNLNMGKKVMTGLQWANANLKYDFILKCDDDVFVDVDALIAILRNMDEKYVYMGNVMENQPVMRSGRYEVPVEEHPAKVFAPYCSGGGYILSNRLVERMIPLFQWEHPLRIDDAYIGERVIKAGGQAKGHIGFDMWNNNCNYHENLLISHQADKDCLTKLQGIIFDKKKRYI